MKLKELQERIKKDGIAVNEDILKVDSFINHQVDPVLMQHIGEAFAGTFQRSCTDSSIIKCCCHGQNSKCSHYTPKCQFSAYNSAMYNHPSDMDEALHERFWHSYRQEYSWFSQVARRFGKP